jgi:hypothetical protein
MTPRKSARKIAFLTNFKNYLSTSKLKTKLAIPSHFLEASSGTMRRLSNSMMCNNFVENFFRLSKKRIKIQDGSRNFSKAACSLMLIVGNIDLIDLRPIWILLCRLGINTRNRPISRLSKVSMII